MNAFKEKTTLFWNKFSEQEQKIREQIDQFNTIDTKEFIENISKIISIAFNDQPFELGHNAETNKYELIFSPNGNEIILMQLIYLVEAMPDHLKKDWTIYSSSPSAQETDGLELYINDQSVKVTADDFTISTQLDANAKIINLDINIPIINELPENDQYNIIFLMLDRCISEIYAMKYVGKVNIVENKKKSWMQKVMQKKDSDVETMPLTKLKAFIDYLITDNGWEKPNYPFESWSAYRQNPAEDEMSLRKDIYVGTTSCMSLISDVLSGEKDIYPVKQLAEDGISLMYVYLSVDGVEDIMAMRNEIEEKIKTIVVDSKVATLIGTATGTYHTYLDYIVFDTETFKEEISSILQDYGFSERGMHYIVEN